MIDVKQADVDIYIRDVFLAHWIHKSCVWVLGLKQFWICISFVPVIAWAEALEVKFLQKVWSVQ